VLTGNAEGLVSYQKLVNKQQETANNLQRTRSTRVMNRMATISPSQALSGSRAARVAAGVFNFEDMLRMQFQEATFAEILRMSSVVSPDRKPMQKLTKQKIIEAVELFKKMDPLETGVASYDSLEDVFINEFPKANVYKLIKTMDETVVSRLFSGGKITINEFVLWHSKKLDHELDPTKAPKDHSAHAVRHDPSEVLSTYISGHQYRSHMQERFMEEARRRAYEERSSFMKGLPSALA